MTRLVMTLHDDPGPLQAGVVVQRLVIAGWTGRDAAQVQAHIDELAAIGVPKPPRVPVFYRAAAARLTTAPRIEVAGPDSSGEAECVVFDIAGRLWVGIGSDHTDRRVEAYGITIAKQMCDKPVGPDLWPLAELASHWDRLMLRAWADGALYQEGNLAALRAPRDLFAAWGGLLAGDAMFCGTLPVLGRVRPARRFAMELEDPVLGRALRHEYEVETLPVEG